MRATSQRSAPPWRPPPGTALALAALRTLVLECNATDLPRVWRQAATRSSAFDTAARGVIALVEHPATLGVASADLLAHLAADNTVPGLVLHLLERLLLQGPVDAAAAHAPTGMHAVYSLMWVFAGPLAVAANLMHEQPSPALDAFLAAAAQGRPCAVLAAAMALPPMATRPRLHLGILCQAVRTSTALLSIAVLLEQRRAARLVERTFSAVDTLLRSLPGCPPEMRPLSQATCNNFLRVAMPRLMDAQAAESPDRDDAIAAAAALAAAPTDLELNAEMVAAAGNPACARALLSVTTVYATNPELLCTAHSSAPPQAFTSVVCSDLSALSFALQRACGFDSPGADQTPALGLTSQHVVHLLRLAGTHCSSHAACCDACLVVKLIMPRLDTLAERQRAFMAVAPYSMGVFNRVRLLRVSASVVSAAARGGVHGAAADAAAGGAAGVAAAGRAAEGPGCESSTAVGERELDEAEVAVERMWLTAEQGIQLLQRTLQEHGTEQGPPLSASGQASLDPPQQLALRSRARWMLQHGVLASCEDLLRSPASCVSMVVTAQAVALALEVTTLLLDDAARSPAASAACQALLASARKQLHLVPACEEEMVTLSQMGLCLALKGVSEVMKQCPAAQSHNRLQMLQLLRCAGLHLLPSICRRVSATFAASASPPATQPGPPVAPGEDVGFLLEVLADLAEVGLGDVVVAAGAGRLAYRTLAVLRGCQAFQAAADDGGADGPPAASCGAAASSSSSSRSSSSMPSDTATATPSLAVHGQGHATFAAAGPGARSKPRGLHEVVLMSLNGTSEADVPQSKHSRSAVGGDPVDRADSCGSIDGCSDGRSERSDDNFSGALDASLRLLRAITDCAGDDPATKSANGLALQHFAPSSQPVSSEPTSAEQAAHGSCSPSADVLHGPKMVRAPSWDSCLLCTLQPPSPGAAPPYVGCCNFACADMAGSSEAHLKLRKCGGCLLARYCSDTCQRSAWRAGHRAACQAWQQQQQQQQQQQPPSALLQGAAAAHVQ